MKQIFLIFSMALLLGSCATLPQPAKIFIATHFPNTTVVEVEREDDIAGYSAELSDRTELEFTKQGDWLKVDAEDGNAIPTTFFPEKIVQFASQNGLIIDGIRKTNIGYKVDFAGNTPDAFFDKDGNLTAGGGISKP